MSIGTAKFGLRFVNKSSWEKQRDRQRIEGGIKKTTGNIKEKAGQALGNRPLQSEGKAEKTEGHIRSGVGKAMDAVREVVNSEKE